MTLTRRLAPYRGVLRARWRETLQYRVAALAGFGTQLYWGLIRLMILAAFYQSGPAGATDFSFAHVVRYVWLGQALLGLFPFRLDHELADSVRTGTVAGELLRPIDLYSFWFWRMVAWRLAMTAPRCLLMLVVAVGILPLVGLGEWALGAPAGVEAAGLYLLATALALLLGVAVTEVLVSLMFWTVSSEGARYILPSIIWFGGGMVVPLPLLPDGLATVLGYLPFAGLMDIPFRIYVGHLAGGGGVAAPGPATGLAARPGAAGPAAAGARPAPGGDPWRLTAPGTSTRPAGRRATAPGFTCATSPPTCAPNCSTRGRSRCR